MNFVKNRSSRALVSKNTVPDIVLGEEFHILEELIRLFGRVVLEEDQRDMKEYTKEAILRFGLAENGNFNIDSLWKNNLVENLKTLNIYITLTRLLMTIGWKI